MVDKLLSVHRSWVERHSMEAAFDLIGAWLVVDRNSQRVEARVVEAEAYGGDEDLASQATMYRVGRQSLSSEAGAPYMQFASGMPAMTNLVGPGNLSRGVGTTLSDTLSPLTAQPGIVVSTGPGSVEIRAEASNAGCPAGDHRRPSQIGM